MRFACASYLCLSPVFCANHLSYTADGDILTCSELGSITFHSTFTFTQLIFTVRADSIIRMGYGWISIPMPNEDPLTAYCKLVVDNSMPVLYVNDIQTYL